jgi:type IV pilus assembly protein PilN
MLKINLLPVREARRAENLRQQLMQLLLVLLVTAGAITMVHSRISEEIDLAQMRVNQMKNDIEQFKPQLDQVAAFRKRKARLEKKIDVIDGLDRARSGPVRVLTELAMRTPDRLWLTTLDTKGTTLTLRGQSLDNELVALFLRGLDDSPYFDRVDLDSTELSHTRSGLKVVDFSIRAVIVHRKPSDKPDGAVAS